MSHHSILMPATNLFIGDIKRSNIQLCTNLDISISHSSANFCNLSFCIGDRLIVIGQGGTGAIVATTTDPDWGVDGGMGDDVATGEGILNQCGLLFFNQVFLGPFLDIL